MWPTAFPTASPPRAVARGPRSTTILTVHALRSLFVASVAGLTILGCPPESNRPDGRPAAGATTIALPDAAASVGTAPPITDESAIEAGPRKHPEVRAMHFTSGVKDKEPIDNLDTARPGKRVYAHLTVRNRTAGPRKLTVSFRVAGVERSSTELDVERSWSYRSWAYMTLKPTDKGTVGVLVKDDYGEKVAEAEIPIR